MFKSCRHSIDASVPSNHLPQEAAQGRPCALQLKKLGGDWTPGHSNEPLIVMVTGRHWCRRKCFEISVIRLPWFWSLMPLGLECMGVVWLPSLVPHSRLLPSWEKGTGFGSTLGQDYCES